MYVTTAAGLHSMRRPTMTTQQWWKLCWMQGQTSTTEGVLNAMDLLPWLTQQHVETLVWWSCWFSAAPMFLPKMIRWSLVLLWCCVRSFLSLFFFFSLNLFASVFSMCEGFFCVFVSSLSLSLWSPWVHLLIVDSGDITVYVPDKNQPSVPPPFLFCSCVCFCLYSPFNCISFSKFSRQLSAFLLCSSGQLYISVKVSLSPDIILCGWRGFKHDLTN